VIPIVTGPKSFLFEDKIVSKLKEKKREICGETGCYELHSGRLFYIGVKAINMIITNIFFPIYTI